MIKIDSLPQDYFPLAGRRNQNRFSTQHFLRVARNFWAEKWREIRLQSFCGCGAHEHVLGAEGDLENHRTKAVCSLDRDARENGTANAQRIASMTPSAREGE